MGKCLNNQKVDFNGTSTFNVNNFGNDPVSGNPLIYWDSTNKLFKFNLQQDANVNVTVYFKTVNVSRRKRIFRKLHACWSAD